MRPVVSVVIPTFNRADRLVRAVESVLEQTLQPLEVLVVDDGSNDRTREVIEGFAPRVRYLAHRWNLGVSSARNTGIRNSGGELLAFLDSDDWWHKEKLALQADFFMRHPEAPVCQTEEIWIRKGCRVNPKKGHKKPSGDIFAQALRRCLVSPSAVMLRRSMLEEVGLFDETLPACEDYDLWLRVSCRHPVYLLPEAVVVKEGGREDQLSQRFWGMDRLRIRALLKLIRSGVLSDHQAEAALSELERKSRIYGKGCLKRGRPLEGAFYIQLPGKLRAASSRPERKANRGSGFRRSVQAQDSPVSGSSRILWSTR